MPTRKKRNPINFTQFIMLHEEQIFGSTTNKFGQSYFENYRKQINALNIKMNEIMDRGEPLTSDPIFLLGLFSMSISQFARSVKPSVELYKDAFLKLLEANGDANDV